MLAVACSIAATSTARAELIACTEDTCACTSGDRVVLVRNYDDGPVCSPAPPPDAREHARWEGVVAGDAGWLGTALAPALGFDLAAGVRFDRLAVLAEYRLLALQADPSASAARATEPTSTTSAMPAATMQRIGVVARYSVLAAPSHELWFEGGVGEELLGSSNRPDLDVGVGWSFGKRAPTHHGAAFVAVRALVARIAGIAGANATIDPAVLLTAGFVFGS